MQNLQDMPRTVRVQIGKTAIAECLCEPIRIRFSIDVAGNIVRSERPVRFGKVPARYCNQGFRNVDAKPSCTEWEQLMGEGAISASEIKQDILRLKRESSLNRVIIYLTQ